MGASDTVPSTFAMMRDEGPGHHISLADGAAPLGFAWARLSTLDLDVATGAPPRDAGQGPVDESLDRLKTRRLAFRRAMIDTDPARLQAALGRCPLAAHGFHDVRVWLGADAPWIAGRASIGSREAPFTIRIAIEPRAEARRRLRLFLGDVRLYGPLPLPAPLVGAALARAIVAGCGGDRPELRAAAGALLLAPLDLVLLPALVARGWRLPDLAPAWLESVERHAGDMRLSFGSERRPTEKMTPLDAPAADEPSVSFLEGGRLPDSLAAAEKMLFSGDLLAAEAAYQQALREHADERGARCRLGALHVAMGAPGAAADERELTARWPDLIPGWLFAAITSSEQGDWRMAAALFDRAARLADARGEAEDARLADEAGEAARRRGLPASTSPGASPAGGRGSGGTGAVATHEPGIEPSSEASLEDGPVGEDGAVQEIARALLDDDRATADVFIAALLGPQADESARAALFTDIAEALLADGPPVERRDPAIVPPPQPSAGAVAALATLSEVSLANSTPRALDLRADLGERLGDLPAARAALGEMVTRAVAAGDMELAREAADRQARLGRSATPTRAQEPPAEAPPVETAIAAPEAARRAATDEPALDATPSAAGAEEVALADIDVTAILDDLSDGAIPGGTPPFDSGDFTGRTAAVYVTENDAQTRAGMLTDLLQTFERLAPERRAAAYASFARVAESTGDLEHATEAYARAIRLDGSPGQKADFLLAHARVLIARGEEQAAIDDLAEAVAIAPDHTGARALLADRAFRGQAWDDARAHYTELDRLGVAPEVLPRETLLHRRAILARAAGDIGEAEACFGELALLDARHVEARQALADIALERGDLDDAARRLEEVVRLLPVDALDALLELRQRLADLHTSREDWGAARHYLELILAQEPRRIVALERLAEAYENLGLYEEAAGVWVRLSRVYVEPARRAEALFRQGEIVLEWLGDSGRAFDAYLKSSDLAPAFAPTALRLISGFWRRGQYEDVADVAAEIDATGALASQTLSVRLRVALAVALAGRTAAGSASAPQVALDDLMEDPDAAARVLGEAAAQQPSAPPSALEPAVAVLASFGPPPDAAGGDLLDIVERTLEATVLADPSAVGPARALGWLADRREDSGRARTFYALATFVDETDGSAQRLEELSPAAAPPAAAFALGGPCDHPDAGGPATAPLRRALGALAQGLAGFGPLDAPAARPAGDGGIPAARREALAALGRWLGAPELIFQAREAPGDELGSGAKPASPADVVAIATRPASILIAPGLLDGPDEELVFLVGRAIDRVRSGRALVEGATSGSVEDMAALLRGAHSALTGEAPPEEGLGAEVAAAMGSPERATAVVRHMATGSATIDDLQAAEDALYAWDAFTEAAARASDRFGLLACRSPLGALRALHGLDRASGTGPLEDDGQPSDRARERERERRIEFLGSRSVRDLVEFMLDPAYGHAIRTDVG
jgi:tetratricopeptide (TPR) repeat protein